MGSEEFIAEWARLSEWVGWDGAGRVLASKQLLTLQDLVRTPSHAAILSDSNFEELRLSVDTL